MPQNTADHSLRAIDYLTLRSAALIPLSISCPLSNSRNNVPGVSSNPMTSLLATSDFSAARTRSARSCVDLAISASERRPLARAFTTFEASLESGISDGADVIPRARALPLSQPLSCLIVGTGWNCVESRSPHHEKTRRPNPRRDRRCIACLERGLRPKAGRPEPYTFACPQVPPARSGQSLGTRADCSRAQPIAKQTQLFRTEARVRC